MAYFDHRNADAFTPAAPKVSKPKRVAEPARVPHPWDVVLAFAKRLRAAWSARAKRREIERMLTFDASLLSDIGVTRDDVRHALTTDDPSRVLEACARRRPRR